MASDDVRAYWDAQAATFDQEADHGLVDPAVRAAWTDLLRSVLPPPPAEVADLGAGTGSLAVLLAGLGYQVTASDASPQMVRLARAKAAGLGAQVSVDVRDAADPGLPEAGLDAVLVRHVLWALPDPAAAVAAWSRLLRPGGRLVLVEGRWDTGGGLDSTLVRGLVGSVLDHVSVLALTSDALWGRHVEDERYLVLGHRGSGSGPLTAEAPPRPR